ncbi:hypothetical protein CAEBREN_03798 [Caenorhabditis brenneri]|uniref:Uncharacterized protein n=1 Tax=Caenorhabditis brenneri TaxID=135651 RepID=G0MKH2_CAEBE|nr:hypothetical protein CAEBREN_03798 [Caenorhabditis brenneri]
MKPRPTYIPSSGDESLMPSEINTNMGIIQGVEIRRNSAFVERCRRFTPGLMLQVFALCKFAILLYFCTHRPYDEKELPLVVVALCLDAILLLSAASQDFCSLIISWIITCTLFVFYLILLITVPIFVTSFFTSDSAGYSNIPPDWRLFRDLISYKTKEEILLKRGIEFGLRIEIVLVTIVFVTGFQFGLLNSTLNAKLDHLKRKRQAKETRNSVYLI